MKSISVIHVLLHLAALNFAEILRKGVQFDNSRLYLFSISTGTFLFPLSS